MTDPEYPIDLAAIREDVIMALASTEGITRQTPCFRCGATQPAHSCNPQYEAQDRLLRWAGVEPHKRPREWKAGR